MQLDTPDLSGTGAEEYRRLLDLAAETEAFLPDGGSRFQQWNEHAAGLPGEFDLETLSGERALDDLAHALRATWLRAAHDATSGYLMSPPHEQTKVMPSGARFQFDYERSSRPEALEARGMQGMPAPAGWRGSCLLFSSGMAAIATMVQVCCARLLGPAPARSVRLDMFGGYFETWRLLDTVHDATLKVEYTTSADQLAERVSKGRSDALVIEPVAYDWDMAVFDRDGLADAWRGAGDARPRLVIVDTSLTAHRFTLGDLLPVFGENPPLTVAFVRSGLKLDQQGLELSNVGIVHIYVPEKEDRPVHLERLRQRLTVNRAITGGALTINQAAALEVPWFLDPRSLSAHADRVFENNRALARLVKLEGGVFTRVNHPTLAPGEGRKWAEAPFVVFHLEESTASRLGMLVAIMVHEARARGLCLDLASSFGFRGHRFEVIQPLMQIREAGVAKGLLKIAMGSRSGPSRDGAISLINEIAAYRDWDSLIAAYRDVRAYAKSSFGVYRERPPRL